MQQKTQSGFTLIELLVVIAIIGLLASVVIASLSSARVKGRDARRVADLKSLQLALELYADDNKGYPPTITANQYAIGTQILTGNELDPKYIAALPIDPINDSTIQRIYYYRGVNAIGNASCTTGPCPHYILWANLEQADAPALDSDVDTDAPIDASVSGPWTITVPNCGDAVTVAGTEAHFYCVHD